MSNREGGERAKKKRKGTAEYYQIEENRLKRLRPSCERCGSGYFMADHGDRFTCGHCGLTRYKQQ
jgi:small subunit ribosomal protein S27Ae